MLKIHSNINIRSGDSRLLTDLPNKSQVMLVLALSVSPALSLTDCTREVRSAVTLTQIKWPSHVPQKGVRLSSDPWRHFGLYPTLTLKWAGQLWWEPRWPQHIPALLCHQEIPLHNPGDAACSILHHHSHPWLQFIKSPEYIWDIYKYLWLQTDMTFSKSQRTCITEHKAHFALTTGSFCCSTEMLGPPSSQGRPLGVHTSAAASPQPALSLLWGSLSSQLDRYLPTPAP